MENEKLLAKPVINSLDDLNRVHEKEMAGRRSSRADQLVNVINATRVVRNTGSPDFLRTDVMRYLLDGPRDIDADCGYPSWLTPDHFRAMYDREGASKRVVDCMPEETWAMDPEVYEDDDPQNDTEFEEAWKEFEKKFNAWHYLWRIDTLSGIGQFGILLIGINDGKDLREPVDGIEELLHQDDDMDDAAPSDEPETTGQRYKVLYLRPFSEDVVFVKTRETDVENPRYGLPLMYTIQFRDFPNWGIQAGEIIARDVHWTRVVHVADNRKISEVYGVPRMQPVYNRLYDLRKTYAAGGEGYWKGAFPGLAFEVNPELADQGIEIDSEAVKQEFEKYSMGQQRYIAVTGLTTKSLPPNTTDPTPYIETDLKGIAIALAIPYRILFGSEEAKLAADQDSRAWNKRVAKRQAKYVSPMIIRPFIDRLIAFGVLPQPKEYFIDWPDLNSPTDQDKAAVALTRTQALQTYILGQVDQLVPPDVYLTEVMGFTPEQKDVILEGAMQKLDEEEMPEPDELEGGDEGNSDEGDLGGGEAPDQGNALDMKNLSRSTTVPKKGKAVDAELVNAPAINAGAEDEARDENGKWTSGGTVGAWDKVETVSVAAAEPPHGVKDKSLIAELKTSLSENGWQGPPLLGYDDGNGVQLLTGSHRYAAARSLDMDVPVHLIDISGDDAWVSQLAKARDDNDRLAAIEQSDDSDAAAIMREEVKKLTTNKTSTSGSSDDGGGHWVTIGGGGGKSSKSSSGSGSSKSSSGTGGGGGVHVYIKGGKITKGPKALVGQAPDHISEHHHDHKDPSKPPSKAPSQHGGVTDLFSVGDAKAPDAPAKAASAKGDGWGKFGEEADASRAAKVAAAEREAGRPVDARLASARKKHEAVGAEIAKHQGDYHNGDKEAWGKLVVAKGKQKDALAKFVAVSAEKDLGPALAEARKTPDPVRKVDAGELEMKLLGDGGNVGQANKVHLPEGPAVWKPNAHTGIEKYRAMGASIRTTLDHNIPEHERELAAYKISEAAGFGIVPKVEKADFGKGHGIGHTMEYKEGRGFRRGEDDLKKHDDAHRMLALDFITGNTDRHMGNVHVGKDGRMYAIDNGLAFPNDSEHEQFRQHMLQDDRGRQGPLHREKIPDAVKSEINKLKPEHLTAIMKGFHPIDIQGAHNRLAALKTLTHWKAPDEIFKIADGKK